MATLRGVKPSPRKQFVDAATGLIDTEWNLFLERVLDELDRVTGISDTPAPMTKPDFGNIFVPSVTNGDIVLILKAPFDMTLTGTVTKAASGTCSANFYIDGVIIGGGANAVSTTEQDVARTSANAIAAGQTLKVTITANASCKNMALQFNATRPA